MQDTLRLELQAATNWVLEGVCVMQSLRDQAQVAHIQVEQINKDIVHMQDYFHEIGDPESSNQVFASADEVDIQLSAGSKDSTSETSQSQGHSERMVVEDAWSTEDTKDVEVELTPSTATPLTEMALKKLTKDIN